MHTILVAFRLAAALGALGRAAPGPVAPSQRTLQPAATPARQPAAQDSQGATLRDGGAPGQPIYEAGIVVPDLRALVRELGRHQDALRSTVVGRAFYAPPATGEPPVGDYLAELEGMLALADAGTGPVPALLALVAVPGTGVVWQLAARTDGRLAERVRGWSDGGAPLGLRAAGDELSVDLAGTRMPATLTADGWLRASPDEAVARMALPVPTFGAPLAHWLEGDLAELFVVKGRITQELVSAVDDPRLAAVLSSARVLTVGLALASDGSMRLRLCLDADALGRLAMALRPTELVDRLTPGFGPDATAFLTLALPTDILRGLVAAGEKSLAESGAPPMPEALAGALGHADGRVGLVSFGWPGDLALGLGMRDAESAGALVPPLEAWLRRSAGELNPELASVVTPVRTASAPAASFALRPDPALAGLRVGAVGNNVLVVSDESRLASLAASTARGAAAAPVAGPLTPLVRATVERPALATAYMVASGDGAVGTLAAWGARLLRSQLHANAGLSAYGQAFVNRLPLGAALLGVESLSLYDLAASLDVNGSILVLEVSASEL